MCLWACAPRVAQPPFVRDAIRIQRFSWHPELIVSVSCTPAAADADFCAGAAVDDEPSACAAGYTQVCRDACRSAETPVGLPRRLRLSV